MNRHDIRLRRERITTGRMQRHKDYSRLLTQHKKRHRGKRASYWIGAVITLLFLVLLMAIGFSKLKGKPAEEEIRLEIVEKTALQHHQNNSYLMQ